MKRSIILMTLLILTACGKARFEAVNEPVRDEMRCVVQGDTAACEDGNLYLIPNDDIDNTIDIDQLVTIVVVVVSDENEDVVCERNNRNKKKCFEKKVKNDK